MNHFNHNHIKHNCNVNVKETTKVAEIIDAFGNLRYKVALTSFDIINDGKYMLEYQIDVVKHFETQQPLLIAQYPSEGDPRIFDYNKAIQIYHNYVKSYTNYVKAETRDHQCIDIYSENIKYTKTTPDCCATCKWSRKRHITDDYIYGISNTLKCVNPANLETYQRNMHTKQDIDRYIQDMQDGHKYRCDDFSYNDIHPTVDQFGICKRYTKAVKPYVPVPGQSITNFIDMRIDNRLDTKVEQLAKDVVIKTVEQEVNNVIQSEETTERISNIIQDNITVTTIEGNNALRPFDDKDGDGIQDRDEPNIDEDNSQTRIIGNLGA